MTDQLPAGTVVGGRYVVDEFLARGGFASVYRAHHQQIGRRLAIKVLDPPGRGGSPETFRQRFLTEAKIAARIEHPGVVSVFDFGLLDDGRAFIAMDLLEGHDLEIELRENGAIAATRFVPMFVECLSALGEGHRRQIVHKDLKPSNLFIVRPGEQGERLVILDFGIAHAFDEPGAHVTQEGGFSGTPAYLAPEYIRYQAVSPAMDVYQMGLILIEALTGAQAVKSATSMGYLLAHCLEPVVLPKALLDTPLGDICLRAVEKEPQDRFRDAEAFREALLDVPRPDLFETQLITLERDPVPDERLAKTLQFIHVPAEEFRRLSGPLKPPSNAPTITVDPLEPDEPAAVPTFMLVAALVVLFIVGVGLAFALSGADPEPPPEPAPTAVVASPPIEVNTPELDLGPVDPPVMDLGTSTDLAATEMDLATPVVVAAPPEPDPVPPTPRPRPRPKAKDEPQPKPPNPLLLSP